MDKAPIPEEHEELPANLKFLRVLVTVLTGTMIAGLVILIVLFVTRFPSENSATAAALALPDHIALPAGATATAFTKGDGWFAIVSDGREILIFDAQSGALTQRIPIN